MPDGERLRTPGWQWAYAVFKLADGLTHALFPLAVLFVYGKPVWAVAALAAAMNLASVPASFAWAKVMERGRGRRRAAVLGFAVSAAVLSALVLEPGFWPFVALAVLFTLFGTATAPAASILALEGVPRNRWGAATGAMSRRTGYAFLLGVTVTVGLGLAGLLDFRVMFAVGALLAATAAGAAWATIRPFEGGSTGPRRYEEGVVVEGQRRFERAVFFPTRLRYRPTWQGVRRALLADPGPFLLATSALFFGTVVFLASYPGVLDQRLGLTAGLILLAQAPSAFLTPLTYTYAGRVGDRQGVSRGAAIGSLIRLLTVPALCLVVLAFGADGFLALLILHGLLGVSFAFIQVNGPCLVAALHPGGRGEGVGAYHAAVAVGTLTGSVVSAAVLLLWDLRVSYAVAAGATVLGGVLALVTLRRLAQDPALAV